jgi:CheY-like chemotaxis protein
MHSAIADRERATASILVVDDEPFVAQLVADLLAGDGHRVDTAPNGRVALEKLGRRAYDMILSDIRMPELDGPGLYDAVAREHPSLRSRIVFISGESLTPAAQAFFQRTNVPFLQKPFDVATLRRVAREVLAAG